MTIKEQIEIARLIASGTPREVAISESTIEKMTDEDIKNTGANPIMQAKLRKRRDAKIAALALRKRNKENRSPDKGGAIVKSKSGELVKKSNSTKPTKVKPDKKVASTEKKPIQSVGSLNQISSDEGGASATQKAAGNVRKGLVKTINLGKRIVTGRKVKKDPIDYKKLAKELNNEEFIQEVEKKEKSATKKVIDIMRGKNSIKVNPDMKEDTVVVQDASGKDFVEVVDIVSPSKVRSDWRKEINVTEASAAWTRKAGKNKSGGLNEKGRKSYERENPGSDLKAPSKKVGNPRRKSFCARMRGMKKKLTSKKTARDPNSRINKSLRAWNC